ncbi:MAG: hypothetical protein EXS09_02975 [Gemmataceae bacterium]|nr:hypothetical protein [Gemmataceae bacterium]
MKSLSPRSVWRPAAIAAAASLLLAPTPVFAGPYWEGFKRYWFGFMGNADGVVITALVVGLISLFIITRGKWAK